MIRPRSAALAAACSFSISLLPLTGTLAAPRSKVSRSSRSSSRAALRLPSRGAVPTESVATVVGRLGVVVTDKAPIRGGRERMGRVLSLCPKGQQLAISGENATQYAVLMIDRSIAYIAKADVQLLDYQVVADPPPAAQDGALPNQPPTNSGATPLGQQMVQTAWSYLGVPYVWGGETARGIDCSGFVRAVYAASGLALPRVSYEQATVGYEVPRDDVSQWVPGDRLYFACSHSRIDHTGMYIGDGKFIHASVGHGNQVNIDPISTAFYAKHLVAVRRSKAVEDQLQAQSGPGGRAVQTASADAEASQER